MTAQMLQVLSVVTGTAAYIFLVLFCAISWFRGITGRALFLASVLTALFIVSLASTGESAWSQSFEAAMLYGWTVLVIRGIGLNASNYRSTDLKGVTVLLLISTVTLIFAMGYAWTLTPEFYTSQNSEISVLFSAELLLCVYGLVAIEQLVRNTREDLRWQLRYMNIGLGLIFSYGLLHNALGLLFNSHVPVLTVIQPLVLSLAVPFIVIASLRNRDNQLSANLSRQFVFRSGVLIACGALLFSMGLAGYFVQMTSGDIGVAAVILLTTVLTLGMFVIVGSTQFKSRVRRFISRHLYDDRHDFREHWARVTQQLTEPNPDFSLEEQSVRALLGIFDAPGGSLWQLSDGLFVQTATHHVAWRGPFSPQASEALIDFFEEKETVIDLKSVAVHPQAIAHTSHELNALADLRFLVPLFAHDQLIGIVGVREPVVSHELSADDHDIVRLVSREVAGFLALSYADTKLSESRQFDSMNRLTTFLVHDLKTISAQLSLLMENARQHKTNPEFIDDLLDTVDNSVGRMQRLLAQLAAPKLDARETICLGELLPEVLRRFAHATPAPTLGSFNPRTRVRADRDKLISAIGHVLQNAIDATDEQGSIRVQAIERPPWLDVEIEDTGSGMDQEFIEKQLFTPFRSTKGVAGMGIGVYQLREYLRSMRGDVLVASRPGQGTCFTLKLPLREESA